MIPRLIAAGILALLGTTVRGQSVVGSPTLTQLDNTSFVLELQTDSAAVLTVHAASDSTYRSAFIFLGRTIGEDNRGSIKMEGLLDSTFYYYRLFLGQELSSVEGTFKTGN